MEKKTGIPTAELFTNTPHIDDPALAPPVWELSKLFGNTITQAIHDSCRDSGYPVLIQPVANSQAHDLIMLYAYALSDPKRTTKYPLVIHTVKEEEQGEVLQLYPGVDQPPLDTDGDYNLAYAYIKADSPDMAFDSLPTPITVKLNN
ncbi:hypothetical protein [Bordetella sp. LUAb4]|uniref:hypothetical protein n=1 Tax=Bordetella sp. LUAb4 TaxID=2843195 RepID=UPI001E5803B9|nr:hypothetical protein [Bordetella sp. LUAb4]